MQRNIVAHSGGWHSFSGSCKGKGPFCGRTPCGPHLYGKGWVLQVKGTMVGARVSQLWWVGVDLRISGEWVSLSPLLVAWFLGLETVPTEISIFSGNKTDLIFSVSRARVSSFSFSCLSECSSRRVQSLMTLVQGTGVAKVVSAFLESFAPVVSVALTTLGPHSQ